MSYTNNLTDWPFGEGYFYINFDGEDTTRVRLLTFRPKAQFLTLTEQQNFKLTSFYWIEILKGTVTVSGASFFAQKNGQAGIDLHWSRLAHPSL